MTNQQNSKSPSGLLISMFIAITVFVCGINSLANMVRNPTTAPSNPIVIDPFLIFLIVGLVLFVGLVILGEAIKRRRKKEKYPRDSIIKIMNKRKSRVIYFSVAFCLLTIILSMIIPQLTILPEIFPIQIILASTMIILLSGKLALDYRILKGWYGNNEREAREIIEFIVRESSNIDFRDGGKLKRILSDDDLEEIKSWGMQPVPGTD